jgi:hypothetical protein
LTSTKKSKSKNRRFLELLEDADIDGFITSLSITERTSNDSKGDTSVSVDKESSIDDDISKEPSIEEIVGDIPFSSDTATVSTFGPGAKRETEDVALLIDRSSLLSEDESVRSVFPAESDSIVSSSVLVKTSV